jgi:tripartite-type tricarboxylate transporter receptor subunit TctC
MLAQQMSLGLGQAVVVENRLGAAGLIALDAATKSPADGYTIGHLQSSSIISGLLNGRDWKIDEDMTPIGLNYQAGLLIAVNPKVPMFKDVRTPVDLLRVVRANPGKVNFSSVGVGSTGHLVGELMRSRAGLDWQHVPYKGGVPMVQDLVMGTDPVVGIGVLVRDVLNNPGRMLIVATTAATPQADVMPLAQAGLPGLEATTWGGFVGPPHLPPAVVKRLEEEYKKAFDRPDLFEKANNMLTQQYLPHDEFGKLIREHTAMWRKVIQENNIKPES